MRDIYILIFIIIYNHSDSLLFTNNEFITYVLQILHNPVEFITYYLNILLIILIC